MRCRVEPVNTDSVPAIRYLVMIRVTRLCIPLA
jgi:hypothetical protein